MRIEQLTFFRFIAAAIVVIFHYGREVTGFSGALVSGPQMVTFFFVLSGFVMGISYCSKEVSNKVFWFARVSRIMPVYLLALFLVVIAYLAAGKYIDNISLLLNLTLLQSWFPPHPTSLNTPGWSLSVEAFFYICFPFLVWKIKKEQYDPVKLVAIAFILWLITQAITTFALSYGHYGGINSISHDLIYYFPITHLCSFLLGVSGSVYFVKRKKGIKDMGSVPMLLIFGAIIYLLNNANIIREITGLTFAYGSSFYAPLFLAFILAVALYQGLASNFLCSPVLVLLGEASFSLYILQKPIHAIHERYLSDVLLGFLPAYWNFWIFFSLLTIISIVTFIYFEKPLNGYLRRKLSGSFSASK